MHKKILQMKKGFTMIEMLMVLAIFTILTSIVMYNYSEFNSKTIMSNMAYEIALSVRQAQVYSLGVRGQSGNEEFDNRYGVYFDTSNGGKNFVFFFDKKPAVIGGEPNGWCDGTSGESNCMACISGGECLEKITLTRDIYIGRICSNQLLTPIDEYGNCISGEGSSTPTASITFDRPNPDSIIALDNSGDVEAGASVGIVVKNKFGNQRAVIIRSTGQISVIMLNDAI